MTNVISAQSKSTTQLINDLAFNSASTIENISKKNRQLEIQLENVNTENSSLKSVINTNAVLLEAYAEAEKVDGFVLSTENSPVLFFKSKAKLEVKNDGSTKVNIYTTANKKVGSGAVWFKQSLYYLSLDDAATVVEPGYYIKLAKK